MFSANGRQEDWIVGFSVFPLLHAGAAERDAASTRWKKSVQLATACPKSGGPEECPSDSEAQMEREGEDAMSWGSPTEVLMIDGGREGGEGGEVVHRNNTHDRRCTRERRTRRMRPWN